MQGVYRLQYKHLGLHGIVHNSFCHAPIQNQVGDNWQHALIHNVLILIAMLKVIASYGDACLYIS